MDLLTALYWAMGIQAVFYFFAAVAKSDKVTDLSYSLSFIIIAIIAYLQSSQTTAHLLLMLAIVIWGLRLGIYLFIRILRIKKDSRFDGIRENPARFARFWFFQGLTVWIVLIPAILAFGNNLTMNALFWFGLIMWLAGLKIESVADYQKFTRYNPKKWMSSGLWKYSRHPNYFGETLLWWGLFIAVVSSFAGLEYLAILGPIYITFILLKVSGIPMLEKKMDKRFGKNKEYQKYKKHTSKFFLWPPKK